MFGQNNNQDDDTKIPEQSIDGALGDQSADNTPTSTWQHPGTPLDNSSHAAPVTDDQTETSSQVITPAADVSSEATPNDLLDIKQQALNQLAPLVGQLDQAPEERFRTTMMMIQASDNQALIKDAYSAAQAITDEKARAQALLDIVNEINYFTQNGHAE